MYLLLKYFVLVPSEQLKHLLKRTNEMFLKGWLVELLMYHSFLYNISSLRFCLVCDCYHTSGKSACSDQLVLLKKYH